EIIRREGFSTQILDRNGEILYDIYIDQNRSHVDLEEIPDYLKQATISIEDKNFYEHQGFDPFGMVRGASRLFTRGRAQGGSTLTQQLVKNALLSPERTVFRKIKEFILAVQIERAYTKDEILQLYLNEIPYGGTAWGAQSASQLYFDKDVSELNLVESAVLAGLPQSPSRYSPYSSNPEAYISRTESVLRRMREDGHINSEQEENAKSELKNIEFSGRGASFKAPHFVQYVQSILEDRYGETAVQGGGLKVTTTLDLEIQEATQDVVTEEIKDVESLGIGNGAAIVIDPQTGEVLAMVGSKDFSDPDYDGQVNVTLSLRQPGSAIKPITYATAFEKGYTPSTLLMDVPTTFPAGVGQPDYEPGNYDGKYRGPIQLRYALANSINVPAVKTLALVGVEDMLGTAYKMGINSLEPTRDTLSRVGLSVTLGGGEVRLLELTGAYGAFLNGGYKVEPVAVLKVEDRDGKVLEENEPEKGKKVLSEETAFIVSHILSDNEARSDVFGPNSLLNIPGRQIAVKTGTTNDKRDNWTVGGDTQVVVGVWVGNNDNSPMGTVASGVSGASPIWRRIIISALEGKPVKNFEVPKNVVTASVDSISGYASHDGYPSRIEYFRDGTQPGEDVVHVKLKVCKNDGKLATPSDVSGGNYDEKEFFMFKEEDPVSSDGQNRWQKGILDWIGSQNNPLYSPPTDYCGTGNPVSVNVDSPSNESDNLPNQFEVRINASSTSDIQSVSLFVDDSEEVSFTSPPFRHDLDLADGTHELKARAKDANGNERDSVIKIGVNVPWNYEPITPTPTPLPTPTPTVSFTPTPTP
ncbi:penicillin-binding protein, partial [Patescibacteria group bacterium]